MLTTKMWGALPASRLHAKTAPDRDLATRDGRRRMLPLVIFMATVAVLLTGCEPAAPAALREGGRLIREGRARQAIEPLKRAITLFGTNAPAAAQAWNHLGLAYHQMGRLNEAAQAYQNALAKDFNLFAARYNRGVLFLEANNLPGAINELTTYTTHEPRHFDAWLKLGTAQLRARQFDPADRSLQQALKVASTPEEHAEALNMLGLSQAQRRRPHEAFQYLHAALRAVTNYPPALLNQAIIAQTQLGDRKVALDRYKAYLDAMPQAKNEPALAALVQRLEDDVRPPMVVTNQTLSATASNLVTRAAVTNPPAAAVARPARPIPPPVSTAKPPAEVSGPVTPTNPPLAGSNATSAPTTTLANPPPREATAPKPAEPPVEVVKVEDDPQMKAAQDLTRPPPSAPPATNQTTRPATVESSAAAQPKPLRSLPPPKPPKEKRSFFSRINPMNLFTKDKSENPETTEAPRTTGSKPTPIPAPATASQPAAPTNRVETVAAAPPRPVFPRYTYLHPPAPPAGDRAAAEPLFAQALRLHEAGRLSDAMATYRRAVEVSPDFRDAWFNLGVAAQQSGDLPAALTAYEHALAIRGADANARYNFALTLVRAGYPVDAVDEFERALAVNPGFADAHLSLANVYAESLGDKAKAREQYVKVLELSPRHPQAAEIRRWLSTNR